MVLSDLSVKRPVFATVLALMLMAFGLLSFDRLAVREYPDISPPIVSVITTYPGASAEVVENRITQVLENEISGLEGTKTISSRSNDGRSFVSVEFDLERNIDEAANDVRDRVGRVVRRLPEDIDPPRVSKSDSDASPIMYLSLSGANMSQMEVTDFAERYVVDRFATISGVSQINSDGSGRPSMRVWLDRTALAARNLTVLDVQAALRRENLELPAGRLDSKDREFQVRVARNYETADEFRKLVVAQGDDGHLIRLGELARIEIGPRNPRKVFRSNGANTIGLGIVKQSTANTVDVVAGVNEMMARVNLELPPGMQLRPSSDDSMFIRAAIKAVYMTIGITTAMVGLVILVFLGSLRAALIPVITIPICLIASFMVLAGFGYTVNLVTLLALVLCIGLVVDDSIVVLENAHRRIEDGELPLVAAFKGTRQVSFAVIATTAVLVAVFAPIGFLTDNIGRIFAELAVTICAAVIFSSVLALSLTPMLCSKLLRPADDESKGARALERGFGWLAARYEKALRASLEMSGLWVGVAAALAVCAVGLLQTVPQEYAPQEDQGSFFAMIQTAEGSTVQHMLEQIYEIEKPLMPLVESGDIQRALVRVPGFGGTAPSNGAVIVSMAPWGKRNITTKQAMEQVQGGWVGLRDARVFAFMRSGISRHGGGQPVKFVLGGPNYDELARWRDIMLARIAENPGLQRVDSDLKETQPQLLVDVDEDRAADLGVSVQSIGRTLQAMMSDQQVTTYVVDGEEYDVVLQARDDQRATPDDLTNLYVRSDRSGELIPLANLVGTENLAGPATLNRYNRLRAVTINANLAPGYPLGEALAFLEQVARDELPSTARIDYKGESLEYKESSGAMLFTFGIALLVVYLVLAAQFESFIHPLIIMVTVPLAVAGGLLAIKVTGRTLNIYSNIGVVMLIGIAAKNGILIVEFINQLRDQGREFIEAIIEGARIRFRPVVMTTISTVMGSVPLMLASGPGSESRRTLGIVMFSGVTIATLLMLFVVPVFYRLFARHTATPDAVARELDDALRLGHEVTRQ